MRKKLGIILPGKIGDIIICLPIVKHYYDLGYDIYWPIYSNIIENFLEYIDYVNFISIPFQGCISKSFEELKKINCEILDLSFTSPESWGNENTKKYLMQNKLSFDEFRYSLANVPFEKKWTICLNRKKHIENDLYNQLVIQNKYALIQKNSSDCSIQKNIDVSKYDGQIIEIKSITKSVFDWLTIIEKAERLLLIESCFTNLIDQLKIKNNKQILILKNGYYGDRLIDNRLKGIPVLKNNWIKI
jgi:hypothetical protein